MAIPFVGCFTHDASARLAFLGLPDDSQSSYRRGPALAPARIREAYDGECYNATTELGVDVSNAVLDLGDVPSLGTFAETAARYRERVAEQITRRRAVFCAGGDHAVTVPVVAAFAVLGEPIHVVQIDAHPDLYDEYEGSRTSHACVAARLLEMPHVASITQLGVRAMNAAQLRIAREQESRLRIHTADSLDELPAIEASPLFVSVDLDGFDPAFAPGVSHPVPGGLTPRQVFRWLHRLRGRLAGMDVVELNPTRDRNDQTAVLAARLLHEGMGIALAQRGG
jgi:agmatinase